MNEKNKTTEKWSEMAEVDKIAMCYYGAPGTGKTTHMAQMAKLGTIIYIDTEAGLKRGALQRQNVPTQNIRVINSDITYTKLEDTIYQLRNQEDAGDLNIIGVVLDSITSGTGFLLNNLIDEAVAKAKRTGQERSPWKIQRDDYGDMTAQMKRILRGFRDLPIHFLISAHAKREQDENGEIRVGPATTPSLADDLIGYSDIIAYTKTVGVEKITHVAVCNPSGRFEAKDRFGVLPNTLAEPTFDRVAAYVNGDLTADTDKIQIEARERFNPSSTEAQPIPTTKETK